MNRLISFIIPAYNEEGSIKVLTDSIFKATKNYKSEIIFIDDGSSDKTYQKMKSAAKFYNKNKTRLTVKAYSLVKNAGKTAALKIGIEKAKGDYFVLMDADLQDDPTYLSLFIEKLDKGGFDLVVGNRTDRYKKNLIKLSSSLLVNKIMKETFGYSVSDMNCGYKAMKRETGESLPLKSDYHRFIPMLAMMNGYRVGEVEISQKKRLYGKSKYGKTGIFRAMKFIIDFLSLIFIYRYSENPFKLFGKTGLSLFSLGFIISAYLSIRWMFGIGINGRPLFFLGILLLILGVNIISLGLLGELIIHNKVGAKNNLLIHEEKYDND